MLDLLTCQDGASVGDSRGPDGLLQDRGPDDLLVDPCTPVAHEYSEQLWLFIGVYVVGTAFIVNVLRVAFNTW